MTMKPERAIHEITKRLPPIGVGIPSVSLLFPINGDQLLIKAEHELPEGMEAAVVRTVQKAARGILQVRKFDGEIPAGPNDFVIIKGAYRLALVPALRGQPDRVVTVKSLKDLGLTLPHQASCVFKEGKLPRVTFRLVTKVSKELAARVDDSYERIVEGVILEPEVADGTMEGGAEGDIYSSDVIRKAMYYWMENAFNAYAHHHTDVGGAILGPQDVVLYENWQTRNDTPLGDQTVRKGAWCQANHIRRTAKGEQLWKSILNGEINSWSIEADAMGMLEEVNGPVELAGEP
jgi:hypothetical protein